MTGHDERHREDADDARGDRDEQDVDEVVAVHLDERKERRGRRRHRARRDPERGRDRRAGQCTLGPDLVGVGDLVDHRDDREERVPGAGEDREEIRDVRGDEVEGLRSRPQRRARDLDHVVDAACGLHRRCGRDDRDDDEHRADRWLPGSSPKRNTRMSVPTPPQSPSPIPPERTPRKMKKMTMSPWSAIRNQSIDVMSSPPPSGSRTSPTGRAP